ncbi:heat shock protein 27-like [Condylostylus longicornis]|uniref:heat shock protein 27-like n=1 Tax=Condylostylus longicornis TaxID=2530218 RepID=UPI00244DCF79|nr:heat shock protein 27-like [Condylostylus longicornis]
MALIPSLLDFHDPWELRRHTHRHRHHRDWDHFGLGITPTEIQALAEIPNLLNAELKKQLTPAGEAAAVIGKDGFSAHLDVKQFKPNEITVKTKDNQIVIEGKHDERIDEHGYISRHFVRKYSLPDGYNTNDVISTLSSDGVLTIKASPPVDNTKERIIQIQQVGPAHLNVRGQGQVEKEQSKK